MPKLLSLSDELKSYMKTLYHQTAHSLSSCVCAHSDKLMKRCPAIVTIQLKLPLKLHMSLAVA